MHFALRRRPLYLSFVCFDLNFGFPLRLSTEKAFSFRASQFARRQRYVFCAASHWRPNPLTAQHPTRSLLHTAKQNAPFVLSCRRIIERKPPREHEKKNYPDMLRTIVVRNESLLRGSVNQIATGAARTTAARCLSSECSRRLLAAAQR